MSSRTCMSGMPSRSSSGSLPRGGLLPGIEAAGSTPSVSSGRTSLDAAVQPTAKTVRTKAVQWIVVIGVSPRSSGSVALLARPARAHAVGAPLLGGGKAVGLDLRLRVGRFIALLVDILRGGCLVTVLGVFSGAAGHGEERGEGNEGTEHGFSP